MGNSGHSQEPRTLWGEAQGSGAGPGAALLALGHRYPCWWPRAAKPHLGSLESCLFSASFGFCHDRSQIQIGFYQRLNETVFSPKTPWLCLCRRQLQALRCFFFSSLFFFTLLLLFFSLATLCKQFRCDLLFQPRGLICGAASPLSVSELNEPSHRLRALLKNKNPELLGCHG